MLKKHVVRLKSHSVQVNPTLHFNTLILTFIRHNNSILHRRNVPFQTRKFLKDLRQSIRVLVSSVSALQFSFHIFLVLESLERVAFLCYVSVAPFCTDSW